jgi:hypothetical protein
MNKRLVPAVLFIVFLLLGGCSDFFLEKPSGSPETPVLGPGEGMLRISLSLSGADVSPSLSARTILPQDPTFSRYELEFTQSNGNPIPVTDSNYREPFIFYTNSAELRMPDGLYYLVAKGYMGGLLVAQSDRSSPGQVTITAGQFTPISFELKPLTVDANGGLMNGVLNYTLGWDGLTQMPARAELLIESYGPDGTESIPISSIPPELTIGSAPGTILLLDKASALVKLTGSLPLPAGQYRLTVTVTMDGATGGISRMDIAHIYGNLTSSGLFFYGSGDLISNVGVPSGTNFITAFNFVGYPHATSVIGAAPGADGTRLIMVMLPSDANLTQLSPEVETAPGVSITSPIPSGPPLAGMDPPVWDYPSGDYTRPTSWTAVDKNGNTQQYTLVVNTAPSTGCQITDFFFREYPYAAVAIDENAKTINVKIPYTADSTKLTPVVSIIGKSVAFTDGTQLNGPQQNFSSSPKTIRVTAEDSSTKDYTLTVEKAANTDAEITSFAISGYPIEKYPLDGTADPSAGIEASPDGNGYYDITGALPYGVSLTNLTPLIQFKGKILDPAPEVPRNFVNPVLYTVTAEDNSTRIYQVTLRNKPGNTDTGIFDFKITNVPDSKVVIGRNPRPDGKIPIVVQVPYGTNELNMIPAITLSSGTSTISYLKYPTGNFVPFTPPTPPSPDSAINFGTPHEGVYRVTSQTGLSQDYVVVVSMDVNSYYVKATGSDIWPDIYSGGTDSQPFKTLAYAVYRASLHPTINKIFVIGELNDTTEGGAWEDAAVAWPGGFHSNGGESGSTFNLIGTKGKKITVTGVSNATLRGTSGKRVLSITGGADLIFEDIIVTGGNAPAASRNGNGGGIYISGNSGIKFSGSITANTARSGGGVYVEDSDPNGHYDFTLVSGGSITGNTATATATTPIAGGGGIYMNNHALVWLAGGTVSGNTTAGSGGGILVNGMAYDEYGNTTGRTRGDEYGLFMTGGTISTNKSNGNASPHGGGGVYVAKGVFEMMEGQISANTSIRQGGGVFVWHNARFSASGTSSITGNEGVGSSKAICSRGYTEMMGRAQADKIYIWNNNDNSDGNTPAFSEQRDSFTLAENARAAGIVLAYDDTPTRPQTRNYIIITASLPGSGPICLIDLEGRLTNYKFVYTDLNDWIDKRIIDVVYPSSDFQRFPLNTFVGGSTVSLGSYELARNGTTNRIELKKK